MQASIGVLYLSHCTGLCFTYDPYPTIPPNYRSYIPLKYIYRIPYLILENTLFRANVVLTKRETIMSRITNPVSLSNITAAFSHAENMRAIGFPLPGGYVILNDDGTLEVQAFHTTDLPEGLRRFIDISVPFRLTPELEPTALKRRLERPDVQYLVDIVRKGHRLSYDLESHSHKGTLNDRAQDAYKALAELLMTV